MEAAMLPIRPTRSRADALVGYPDGRRRPLCFAWATPVLAASLVAPPLAAGAQQPPKIAKIGVLISATPAAAAHFTEVFRQGLGELGHVEGKTFVLELRYGEARADRISEIARELVSLKVDVIVLNMKTAKALGIRFPQSILVRANQAIQ
jgi:ABC-type uncharacterized transport system substrate-binding protein